MKTLPFLIALVLACFTIPAHADTRTSADYAFAPDIVDTAGGRSTSAEYQLLGSLSDIGSVINAASKDTTLWNGFAGQLLETAVALPSGPVAWWRAENDALDALGSHLGTLWAGAGFAPGIVGQAFGFENPTGFVAVASAPGVSFGAASPMTVELWALRKGDDTLSQLVGKGSACDGSVPNYQLGFNSVSGEGLHFGAHSVAASGVDLPLGTWTHVAGTFDGAAFRIYVNGELKATQVGTLGPESTAPLVIGGSGDCRFFVGLLDEVTLYDRALSGAEIQAIYTAGANGKATGSPVIRSLAALPSGKLNTAYSQTLDVTLGTAPYTFAPVGTMPPGLTLSSAGQIGGAPTAFGTLSFTAQVTDVQGKSSTKIFTLYVLPYSGNAYVWNRGAADWSSAGNWIPNGIPGPNDMATIDGGEVYVSADTSIAQLNLNGGRIDGTGLSATLTVNGVLNWTGGLMFNGGRTLIAPSAIGNLGSAGGVTLIKRTLENAGVIHWIGAGEFTLGSAAVVLNQSGAVFEVQSDGSMAWNVNGYSPVVNNNGVFRKSAGEGTTTIGSSVAFNNSGTIDVRQGTLLWNTTFNNSGRVTVAAGATARLAGGGAASGDFGADKGGLMEFAPSSYVLNDGAQLTGTGTHRVSGGLLAIEGKVAAQNLEFSGGQLDGGGVLTVNGVLNWTGGIMSGSGTFTGRTVLARTAVCNLNTTSSSSLMLLRRVLENGGVIHWIGTGDFTLGSAAVILNQPGAVFDVQSEVSMTWNVNGYTPVINNIGTFRKSAGAGTATVGSSVTFNNSGTTDVQRGTLLWNSTFDNSGTLTVAAGATARLAGGGVSSGHFDAASGGVVEFPAGSYSLNDGAHLTGAGVHRFSGATVSISAPVSVQNLALSAGLITGPGALTANGIVDWTGGTMAGSGSTMISFGALLTVGNDVPTTLTCNRAVYNSGTVNVLKGLVNFPTPMQNLSIGLIKGKGTLRGTVASSGITSPGTSPGQLTVAGDFSQSAGGLLDIELAGNTPGINYDLLSVGGGASLEGTLRVTLTDGFYPNTNAVFTFLTSSSRSGNFAALHYPSNDVGLRVTNTPNSFALEVINVRPVLAPIPDQTNQELSQFRYTVSATDADRPSQSLTYSLTNSPAGATINPSTGQITWTPSEAQGPMTTNITVKVTDNGTPNLTVSRTFAIRVNEVNAAPVLTLPPDTNVNKLVHFTATATATDPDIPTNLLTFALVSGPAGLTVSTSGVIDWTPTKAQGPNTNTVTISVTDTNPFAVNATSLSVTSSFKIVVNETSHAPVLGLLNNYQVNVGQTVSFTATATDADLPPNTLSFSLPNSPAGAAITSDGRFTWRPGVALRNTTNTIQVRVQDNGVPVLSDTRSFRVIVNPLATSVELTPLGLVQGQFMLGVTGPLGPDYVIMGSPDLLQWSDLATNLSPTLPFQHADSQARSITNRVYRVRLQP